MENELEHVGVLGMRWGVRKSEETGSADHRKAKKQTGFLGPKTPTARKRFEMEKNLESLQKSGYHKGKENPKDLTTAQLKTILSDKVMKSNIRDLKDGKADRTGRKIVLGVIVAYGLYSLTGFNLKGANYVAEAIAKHKLMKLVYQKRAKETAAAAARAAKAVIDVKFN